MVQSTSLFRCSRRIPSSFHSILLTKKQFWLTIAFHLCSDPAVIELIRKNEQDQRAKEQQLRSNDGVRATRSTTAEEDIRFDTDTVQLGNIQTLRNEQWLSDEVINHL